jgi:hypothetical protein
LSIRWDYWATPYHGNEQHYFAYNGLLFHSSLCDKYKGALALGYERDSQERYCYACMHLKEEKDGTDTNP